MHCAPCKFSKRTAWFIGRQIWKTNVWKIKQNHKNNYIGYPDKTKLSLIGRLGKGMAEMWELQTIYWLINWLIDWIGLNCIGMDWIELDWIGLDDIITYPYAWTVNFEICLDVQLRTYQPLIPKTSQASAWCHRYIGYWMGKTEDPPTGSRKKSEGWMPAKIPSQKWSISYLWDTFWSRTTGSRFGWLADWLIDSLAHWLIGWHTKNHCNS